MTGNVIRGRFPGDCKGPGGPEDPMPEQRVAELEKCFQCLEPKFETATGALQRIRVALRDLSGLRGEMTVLKTDLQSDFDDLKTDLKTEISQIKARSLCCQQRQCFLPSSSPPELSARAFSFSP